MSEENAVVRRPSTLVFAPDVVLQIIDGEALLLKLHREDVFALNPTGARIAELVTGGLDVDAIVDVLADEYGAERTEIAQDVEALVEELVARGLLIRAAVERSE